LILFGSCGPFLRVGVCLAAYDECQKSQSQSRPYTGSSNALLALGVFRPVTCEAM
jgi:hypothetical protein